MTDDKRGLPDLPRPLSRFVGENRPAYSAHQMTDYAQRAAALATTALERRLFLALAWGKWLARDTEQIARSMDRCKMLRAQDGFGRGDGNWGILVQDDPWALQYQRLDFRIARAKRAVGAQGIIAVHRYGQETVSWPKGSPEIVEYNCENFQSNQRARAFKACQLLADKRHPAEVVDEEWDNRNPPENEYEPGFS